MSPTAMFGYTGLAYFDVKRTDGWILELLEGKRGMVEALPALVRAATDAFGKIPVEPEWKTSRIRDRGLGMS